ncbi:MAG: YebC/PmpR family DNA-binding transcriptional regulator [Chloroflexi bacterium]|nr:YebC/PmpR family DNA-binding transcriptional regulator [Chloroflexota bacterium]
MAGHSKWANIKHRKSRQDAKRGAVFTKLARAITIAARNGGGDPEMNFELRLAIDKAKEANMPKDNIERAVKRGTGELKDGAEIEEITYEAYAPHGIALLIECATDNRNRTVSDIKSTMSRSGGSMAEPGSVGWQFEQKGYITINAGGQDFDELFMTAAEAGADDVVEGEEIFEIFTEKDVLHSVAGALEEAGYKLGDAKLDWVATNEIELGQKEALKVLGIIEQLEDLDDVQTVYSNLNISDEVMVAYEAAG